MTPETKDRLVKFAEAAKRADWMQVVFNQGPPCFHLENDGRFCLRAERWAGHDGDPHHFVSLSSLIQIVAQMDETAAPAEKEK